MSPARLAWRSLVRCGTRSVLAIVLIAASLSVLDLYAGHIASDRARMEYQAVIGERLGHLSIQHAAADGAAPAPRLFTPDQTGRVLQIAEASEGVALALPQMRVAGIASTGERSALFFGEGIVAPSAPAGARAQSPGTLDRDQPGGIAVSGGQAAALGLVHGSTLTLTGTSLGTVAKALDARVVDIYPGPGGKGGGREPLLMPFGMAQALLDTEQTERIVVYLSEPVRLEERRLALAAALRSAGIPAHVRAWHEQSPGFAIARGAADIAFDSVAGMVFAVIAATVAATISMNALERRREVATLRALGMRSSAVFIMFVTEALWMAISGVLVSLVVSGLIAWIINRAALSYATAQAVSNAPMLVELDFDRMGMAVLTVLAVALLAALVPAFKAARGAIAPALSA